MMYSKKIGNEVYVYRNIWKGFTQKRKVKENVLQLKSIKKVKLWD